MNNCGTSKSGCHCCWCKMSFALGLTSGLVVFVLGLLGTYGGHGLKLIECLSTMYPGFMPTVWGSLVGGFWAFLHVFIFFAVAGIIYRLLSKCCNKCCCNKSCGTENSGQCSTERK